jgi:hypothetical protein
MSTKENRMINLARNLAAAAFASVLAFAGCAQMTPAQSPGQVSAGTRVNMLSAAEKRDGWKLLFDGATTQGWRVYRGEGVPEQWKVEDGALTLTARGGGDLVTVDEFGDFELSLEWKISPNGNSGVMYRVKEAPEALNTWNTGPEMQVLDDAGHRDGKIPSHRAGALYDFAAPLVDAAKPVGEWNRARVVLRQGKIEHWLNGQLVATSSYGDDAWRAAIQKTKFRSMPLFGQADRGRIAIQDHGDRVWYRDIKIREF